MAFHIFKKTSTLATSVLWLVIVFLLIGNPLAVVAKFQFVALYNSSGSETEHRESGIFFRQSQSDLRYGDFDDQAVSVIVCGIWIFYENYDYNTGNSGAVQLIIGETNERLEFDDELKGKVSSVRFAGNSNDLYASAVTLYEDSNFQGEQQYTTEDIPYVSLGIGRGGGNSLILTGCHAWTFYPEPNFQGRSFVVDLREQPNWWYSLSSMEDFVIQSVRIGCYGIVSADSSACQTDDYDHP